MGVLKLKNRDPWPHPAKIVDPMTGLLVIRRLGSKEEHWTDTVRTMTPKKNSKKRRVHMLQ